MRISTSLLLLVLAFIAPSFPLRAAERQTIHFTGTVTDVNGKPLEGATVQINNMREIKVTEGLGNGTSVYFSKKLNGLSDADGKYDVPLIFEPVGQPRATCILWFEKKGYVREYRTINFSPVSQTNGPMAVVLKEGLILSGNLNRGSPTSSAFTSLLIQGRTYKDNFLTDSKGNFEIYVPQGEYQVSAGHGNTSVRLDGVKAGSTNLVLRSSELVWSEVTIGREFDDFCRTMNQFYSYFFLKTNIDWDLLKQEYRPIVSKAKKPKELAESLQPMLAKFQDLHIAIEYPGGTLGTWSAPWNYNGNGDTIRSIIESPTICGKYAAVGRVKPDGFGYFLMINQSAATPELVKQAAEAIVKLKDSPGFIIDLRRANGGSEPLAVEIAKLFCAQKTVYAKSKYRNGSKHTDFTKEYDRVIEPFDNPYTKPVVCIIGPGTVSSGEGFAKMMISLPNVTTVGLRTRGASGNPKRYQVGQTGVVVTLSSWVDMMPNGETFEGRGIPPDVTVDEPPAAYTDKDPTLAKALEVLRQKVAGAKAAK
ncbi:MAG TPA: S41 family peptidase [Verrucomicrobiae bacterium]